MHSSVSLVLSRTERDMLETMKMTLFMLLIVSAYPLHNSYIWLFFGSTACKLCFISDSSLLQSRAIPASPETEP